MKYSYRIIPFDAEDVEYMESWLSDMASRGLFYKDSFARVARLEKGEPKQFRYRLEPVGASGEGIFDDVGEMYAQFGWEYVDTLWDKYYILRTSDPSVPELHTDPVLEGEVLRKAVGSAGGKIVSAALYAALLVGLAAYLIFRTDTPVLSVIQGGSVKTMFIFVMLVVLAVCECFGAVKLAELRRRLKNGEVDHRIGYKRAARRTAIVNAAGLLMCIGWLVVLFADGASSSGRTLDIYSDSFPFPMAQAVDEAAAGSGWVVRREDALMPASIELHQYGEDHDGGPRYSVDYYEFVSPRLAEIVFRELKRAEEKDTACRWQALEPDKDGASGVYHAGSEQTLLMISGAKVIEVRYSGNADLRACAGMYA